MIEYIYLHIPFCRRKCGYCSFYSEKYSHSHKEEFLKILFQEIKLYKQQFEIKPLTIYFGGGTPSLLSAAELDSIIAEFEISDNCEITLEANPFNIDEDYTESLSHTSINRISLGSQSFLDKELKLLGRLHNSEKIYSAFEILRKTGFENISLDLIYGLPDQKKEDVEFSLEKMIELEPEHISTYCLSLEKAVPLFQKKPDIPVDETLADFYFSIREKLYSAGFEQYEISNFAKPGSKSRHNLSYWNDKSYLGFGPAASGYLKHCHHSSIDSAQDDRYDRIFRYSNPADLGKYFEMIETSGFEKHRNGRSSSDCLRKKPTFRRSDKSEHSEVHRNFVSLNSKEHEKEFIFLSLRKTEGLNLECFKTEFGIDFVQKYEKIIAKYLKKKYLEIAGDFIRLTPKAYFVSNEIFSEFV